jgi:hypothetical protein
MRHVSPALRAFAASDADALLGLFDFVCEAFGSKVFPMKQSLDSGHLNGIWRPARKVALCLLVSFWGVLVLAGILSATASYAAPDYTSNPRYGSSPRVVSVWIDPNFTEPERVQVLSAVEEWNAALNGVARIDVVASTGGQGSRGGTWLIRRGPGKEGVREAGRKAQSFGTIQAMPLGGGVLLVFPQAIALLPQYSLSLRDVMMRELGHLVGLRHQEHGELLAQDYAPGDLGCVNQATAAAVAAILNVPVTALNWCELK